MMSASLNCSAPGADGRYDRSAYEPEGSQGR
jgi:hypothetical protein